MCTIRGTTGVVQERVRAGVDLLYGPDGQPAVAQAVDIDSHGIVRLTTEQQELRLGGKVLRPGDGR